MKALLALCLTVLLSACAAPHYSGRAIEPAVLKEQKEIVVVKSQKTRESFLAVVEAWLKANEYKYRVVEESATRDPAKLTLTYEGRWGWDVALFLSHATIDAKLQDKSAGSVFYAASLSPNKFGPADRRINIMLDALFGKLTMEQAAQAAK